MQCDIMRASPVVENSLRRLFRRCVQCPPQAPQCPPSCPGTQVCTLVPPDCNTCAHMVCIDNPNPPAPSGGPDVGAIAGGVLGGVAFIVVIVFFIWFFLIKKRREQQDKELQEEWEQDEIAYQKRSMRLNSIHDAASTRTRGSLANSILSRASNFIQIAYIPGVTNRNESGRNSILTPVPPIPAAHRQGAAPAKSSPLSNDGEALFFGIDDLRGSTISAGSNRDTQYSNKRDTRLTMNSITPSLARESVASDVFWDDATAQPMPASAATRLAPRMVSIKTPSNPSTPGSVSPAGTPPEHLLDQGKDVPVMVPGQGAGSNPSVRGKATQVTLNKGRFPVKSPGGGGSSPPSKIALPDRHIPLIPSPLAAPDASSATPGDSLINNVDFSTPPAVPQPIESPFFDATEMPNSAITAASSTRPNPYASMASTVGVGTHGVSRSFSPRRGGSKGKISELSAVIEEAARRASTSESMTDAASKADPFTDEHRVED